MRATSLLCTALLGLVAATARGQDPRAREKATIHPTISVSTANYSVRNIGSGDAHLRGANPLRLVRIVTRHTAPHWVQFQLANGARMRLRYVNLPAAVPAPEGTASDVITSWASTPMLDEPRFRVWRETVTAPEPTIRLPGDPASPAAGER